MSIAEPLPMATLERAIAIAARAHEGQVDKAGAPYILHPLRVMLRLATPGERIVGVLHDVLEDTEWTRAALAAEGFSPEVLDALDAVTRQPGEDYPAFVARAGANPIGRRVKLADLADNTDPQRIALPGAADAQRQQRYQAAIALLSAPVAGDTAR